MESDSIFPNAGFLFLNIRLHKYGFNISQLHNFLFFTLFSSFKKRSITIPNWGQHFGRGTNQKGESIFTGKNFAIWKFRVEFFQQDEIQDSNSVIQFMRGWQESISRKGGISAFRQKREGKGYKSFLAFAAS